MGFIPTFVFGLRPSMIDSMSEGSLSRVWEMPAIAPTAQNRRAPSSSRRRNFEQSPQYGAIMRASGAATQTAGETGETGYPQKPVFASADAMQRYRCVPDPTWPQLSHPSARKRTRWRT